VTQGLLGEPVGLGEVRVFILLLSGLDQFLCHDSMIKTFAGEIHLLGPRQFFARLPEDSVGAPSMAAGQEKGGTLFLSIDLTLARTEALLSERGRAREKT